MKGASQTCLSMERFFDGSSYRLSVILWIASGKQIAVGT